ncbi:MAG: ETC complex I subunit [Phyllobacteriaceae bacterium]|nr:ETC complex I subunit [Phyllobacteriaceae bacterium]
MTARIYSPARTATQSGKCKAGLWLLEHEPEAAKSIDPLTGYTSSVDMKAQVRLRFASREEAVAYAEKQGLAYRVEEPHAARPKAVSYSDNFKFDRKQSWTH